MVCTSLNAMPSTRASASSSCSELEKTDGEDDDDDDDDDDDGDNDKALWGVFGTAPSSRIGEERISIAGAASVSSGAEIGAEGAATMAGGALKALRNKLVKGASLVKGSSAVGAVAVGALVVGTLVVVGASMVEAAAMAVSAAAAAASACCCVASATSADLSTTDETDCWSRASCSRWTTSCACLSSSAGSGSASGEAAGGFSTFWLSATLNSVAYFWLYCRPRSTHCVLGKRSITSLRRGMIQSSSVSSWVASAVAERRRALALRRWLLALVSSTRAVCHASRTAWCSSGTAPLALVSARSTSDA
mmetsp:Transcript_21250/g.46305  ORF Transcript_21250/g.46305 Transcript_21250/m.46305 type:complete len:306 (+) Transcript_21250:480-1397(+)